MRAKSPLKFPASLPVLLALMFVVASFAGCKAKDTTSTVSEAPDGLDAGSAAQITERISRIGMRARVAYDVLEAVAAREIPDTQVVTGSKQLCKRIIGIKACGTANWDINVRRAGVARIKGYADTVQFALPLAFDGVVGMDGKVARALKLSALDVDGAVFSVINIALDMRDNWCPRIRTDVKYEWTKKPRIAWQAGLKFSLESVVNDALDKQLANLESKLNESIDCEAFRSDLQTYWRNYTFPLSLPNGQNMHLNIQPVGFAYSGIQADGDALGVSFAIDARSIVDQSPIDTLAQELPPLNTIEYSDNQTEFALLVRASYEQLEEAAKPSVIGKTFSASTAAGPVAVEIRGLRMGGNTNGVTVSLEFEADLPGSKANTNGVVHLTALPVVDAEAEKIMLANISMTKVLDSTLWQVIGAVFEGQIIKAVEREAVVDLSDKTAELEAKLLEQLNNPDRTGGLKLSADNLTVRLLELIPEADALAAVGQVSAAIDIDVPLDVIKR